MYQTELHAHTSEVSCCGKVDAETLVRLYIQAGYSGVVITDHYNRSAFDRLGECSHEKKMEHYLSGWRAAKKAAQDRLHVILGMELTFFESANDYLVYGIDEDFLFRYPDLMEMGIDRFSVLAKEHSLLVYQAHPFRNGMKVISPKLLHGIEIYNANKRHDSRNDIAAAWAEKFALSAIGGSDFHQPEDVGLGGILTESEITDIASLMRRLNDVYELIR